MDPFLESPDIWPDFHDALAAQIRSELNRSLPAPYYARLEMRPEVGIIGDEIQRRIVPDISVQHPVGTTPKSESVSVALANGPRTDVSRAMEISVPAEPIKHHFIEVRDSRRGHVLVTLIEIVSPSNKCLGVDRQAYEDKQHELLHSDASLVEIDLLRSGRRIVGGPHVIEAVSKMEPRVDYLVSVSRSWRRGARLAHQLFPFTLRDMLPCIPIPLREGETEVPLDLQYVLNLAYDSGPYRRGAVDYLVDPVPPLETGDQAWADQRLRDVNLRKSEARNPKS
jgi:hypothetical protein